MPESKKRAGESQESFTSMHQKTRKITAQSQECIFAEVPYVNDPFAEQLRLLHAQFDGQKPDRVSPISRAGFTFNELQNTVLPAFSDPIEIC